MIESIEKLRKYKLCDKGERFTAYINADELADEIEAEIESRYMVLPVDADGVPIRPDDLMACKEFDANDFDVKEYVLAVSYDCWVDKEGLTYIPCNTRHHKQRTIEDVLADFASKQHGITQEENDALIAECADELRKLMEVDA